MSLESEKHLYADDRSYLFVPAQRPERIAKARAAGADAVIADLEDAVAPHAKAAARDALAAHLDPQQPVLVRINAPQTPWFADDLALCARPGVAGVVLPKAETGAALDRVAAVLGERAPVYCLIETALGMHHALALAQHRNTVRLMFGAIDFQLDTGISGEGAELDAFRSQLVLYSRLAGLGAPVDGVTAAFDDPARTLEDTRRARRFGFGAKLCIHPQQIAPVHEGFSPSAEQRQWAERIVAADRNACGAVTVLDGRMIDRPVVELAKAVLRMAQLDARCAKG